MAARALGLDLRVVPLQPLALRDLYEACLVLVRPDQTVAWRGNCADRAQAVLDQAMGRSTMPQERHDHPRDRRAG